MRPRSVWTVRRPTGHRCRRTTPTTLTTIHSQRTAKPTSSATHSLLYAKFEDKGTASDGSGATETQTITVNVTDANDAPSITSDGGGANAALNAAEETTAVTTVTADDFDGDTVSFAITGVDDAAQFSIDPNSGALTFLKAPDFENPADANGDKDYQVVVQASDERGGIDAQILAVTVTDLPSLSGSIF